MRVGHMKGIRHFLSMSAFFDLYIIINYRNYPINISPMARRTLAQWNGRGLCELMSTDNYS